MQYRLTIDVFCHVEQTSNAGKALAEQRAFARCKVAVRDGGLARAVTHYADHPSPHLIIVEDDGDTSTLQSRLDALAQVVEPGRKLIVVGAVDATPNACNCFCSCGGSGSGGGAGGLMLN